MSHALPIEQTFDVVNICLLCSAPLCFDLFCTQINCYKFTLFNGQSASITKSASPTHFVPGITFCVSVDATIRDCKKINWTLFLQFQFCLKVHKRLKKWSMVKRKMSVFSHYRNSVISFVSFEMHKNRNHASILHCFFLSIAWLLPFQRKSSRMFCI